MNRRYILIGMLAASLAGQAQDSDTLFRKRTLRKTEVQALFSLYSQDGDHSAVTGGTGTEQLTVYATEFTVEHTTRSLHMAGMRAGVDVISSASTDRIDFVMSSASKVDTRTFADFYYRRNLPRHNARLLAGAGFSSESDYLSVPAVVSYERADANGARRLQLVARAYFDDLRWGRYTHGLFNPQKLVYPAELRYREWYDQYRRTTWQLTAGLFRPAGTRSTAALVPGLILQQGLLATPFQRVYFTDDSVRTENFPDRRWRFPVSAWWDYHPGGTFGLRATYSFYSDNFGITAHALQAETPMRLGKAWRLTPFLRVYRQTASPYFKPYRRHDPAETYYTSDYDLSAFTSVKAGLAARLVPRGGPHRRPPFDEVELRYAVYSRGDGLLAHSVSLLADIGFSKPK